VDDPAWVARFAETVAAHGGRVVVVHGGGKEVTALQRRLGAEPEWRDGLRVTSPAALRAVSMVLSGMVNKRLAAALVTAGVEGVGISGEDGGLLRARVSGEGEMGRTGEIERVRTELLRGWLGQGLTPVVSPVSRGPDGGALNVNADDAAAAIAEAMGASELLFVSNVPGVLCGGERLESVGREQVEELIADGTAEGGMAPKLRAAGRAAARVASVRIGDLEMLSNSLAGTRLGAPAVREATR
jgi:acetylglutamate kinase